MLKARLDQWKLWGLSYAADKLQTVERESGIHKKSLVIFGCDG